MSDGLDAYRAKRDFAATPEPAPGTRRATRQRRFVVQEHHATRLHWDLRLEHEGALASWALPRFLPGDGGDNRIAVRTEDHPLEYLGFHGEIPKGSYGAGTMTIYDSGTYELLKWDPRKVEVELHGERLTGRWALFAIGDDGSDQWMIHRMGAPLDPDAEPLPQFIAPMLATPGTLPAGDGWAYEVKWDGVRAIARSEPGRLTLWARSGTDVTARYPELAALNRALESHSAVLDGEIVVLDERGRPSFQALQPRIHLEDVKRVARLAKEAPVTYVIFDLLWVDGHSVADQPYARRRELLAELGLDGSAWRTAEALPAGVPPDRMLEAVRELELEGIVAKRLDSIYAPGRRSHDWVKVRDRQTADLVIGGWLPGKGGRVGRVGALLVGEPGKDGALRYVGRVGSGLTEAQIEDLGIQLSDLAREDSPFAAGPAPPAEARWVQPRLLAQVGFTERSREGMLRHPVWLGLRDDVGAPLILEQERSVRGRREATAIVGQRQLRVTSLDKVMYPATGTTKREVIEYYAAIAPVLVPHLRGRPLTLKRYPDGVDGEAFYEKRAPSHRPEWVTTAAVASKDGAVDYVDADDAATIVWLAQLAAIELHPPLATAASPDRPTCVVFDLDPGAPATIVECCRVAILLRGMLDGVGLDALAKTSGSKGLQIYVPLNRPEPTFEATRAFSASVASVLAAGEPDLVVDKQAKAIRKGKVLVDWYQNERSKSTVSVYSLRARERPRVSTPVMWDEVEECERSGDPELLAFGPDDVRARVAEHGDLFGEVLTRVQRLPG